MAERTAGAPGASATVFLVGAGPGDPGLLTVRARELLDRCDVVVYDAGVPRALLPAPRSTTLPERHQVAAEADGGPTPEKVARTLVGMARAGRAVVRLYRGDPFLFGRGSLEAQALREAAVDFEVVAGVPEEIAGPAAAGVPVAHPGLASAVTLASASGDGGSAPGAADWAALARTGGTLVVRGVPSQIALAARGLRAGGMAEDVPTAVVAEGATARQRTAVGTLATLAEDAAREGIVGEAVAVFGWPVVLRDELAWMERRPLFGRRVVVTRPDDAALSARLRELGADVLAVPATRIEPLALHRLVEALGQLDEYRFVIFTSRHAVRVVWEALRHGGRDARAFAGAAVCAVGSATAAALLERGIAADVVPERFSAEGLVDAMAGRDDVSGARALYPAAEGARDVIPEGLLGLGADVDVVPIYRSAPAVAGAEGASALRAALKKREVHAVTFSAPSTVRAFVELVGAELAAAAPAVAIGAVTSDAAREAGLAVAAEAATSSVDGLVDAVVKLLGEGGA